MRELFDLSIEYGSAGGFGKFTPTHLLWLIACAALTAHICRDYTGAVAPSRAGLRRRVALICVGVELLRALVLMAAGEYDVGRLPLHLCGMAVYACLLHALSGGELLGQFLYAFCLPGAASALLFPDWSYYPALHFMSVCGFLLHTLVCAYVLMLTFGGDLKPDIRRAPACLALMLLLAVPVYAFDRLADTNYMFLNWPSAGSPLEWFAFLGRPAYLLGYLPLLAAVWALIYFPFRREKN